MADTACLRQDRAGKFVDFVLTVFVVDFWPRGQFYQNGAQTGGDLFVEGGHAGITIDHKIDAVGGINGAVDLQIDVFF